MGVVVWGVVWFRMGPEVPPQKVPVILNEYPEEHRQAVGEEGVEMLIAIAVARRGAGGEPHEGGKVDIFVHPVDVGIGVMDEVVRDLPNVTVGAEEVEAEA